MGTAVATDRRAHAAVERSEIPMNKTFSAVWHECTRRIN